ncbi:hypothetical protein EDD29_1981 [Actinocorallia herbida]|uniref:Uncharacterized protein n=1 Tax=Actinocorallia herbida TaxID=58109 RepID=A0A3N1CT14_9ACTN|nr:hypothetical protein EDD29_1981 [Actinocorallia herbida]
MWSQQGSGARTVLGRVALTIDDHDEWLQRGFSPFARLGSIAVLSVGCVSVMPG